MAEGQQLPPEWFSQYTDFEIDTNIDGQPLSFDIQSPTMQSIQDNQPLGVTSPVGQLLPLTTMAHSEQSPMQQWLMSDSEQNPMHHISTQSLSQPPLQHLPYSASGVSQIPNVQGLVAPVANMGAETGFQGLTPLLGNGSSSTSYTQNEITDGQQDGSFLTFFDEEATQDLGHSLLNSSYLLPQEAMQPASEPYYGNFGNSARSSKSPLSFDAEEHDRFLGSDPMIGFNEEDPYPDIQGFNLEYGNIDPAFLGGGQVPRPLHSGYLPMATSNPQLPFSQQGSFPVQESFSGPSFQSSNSTGFPRVRAPANRPDLSIICHRWGDDPMYFTDSETESSGRKRPKKLRQQGCCSTPKRIWGSKKAKKGKTGEDAGHETDSGNDTTEKRLKAKLRPRVDPKHPHVRQSKLIGYKNSRGEDLEEFEAGEHYTPLQVTPQPWDCFAYTPQGELESDRRYTVEEIWRYLYQHPLHHNGYDFDPKNSKLQLRIQRVPADSERRYPGSCSSICRFADCQRKPDNDIRIGHYRVAFDEQSHEQSTNDPFVHAGYVHLYCLEKLMNLPQLVHDLNFRIENRHLPCEVKGDNKMAMDNEKVYTVAYNFLKACNKGTFLQKYPNYPQTNGLSPYNFEDDHEGTLTKALTVTKVAAEPVSKRKKRLIREAAQAEEGKVSCNVDKHLGNLATLNEFDKRKSQFRIAKTAAQGKKRRKRGGMKRKNEELDSDDDLDGPHVLDDGAPGWSRPAKRPQRSMPVNEPYHGGVEGAVVESVEEGQVSRPLTRSLTRSQEAEIVPRPSASAKGKEVIYDSITLDTSNAALPSQSSLPTRSRRRSRVEIEILSSPEPSPRIKEEVIASPMGSLFSEGSPEPALNEAPEVEDEGLVTPITALFVDDRPETVSRKRLRDADDAEIGPSPSPLRRASKRLRQISSH
ncbi:MAG: hypothetical protein M1812_002093 [Candelaria pacifica]|nr:MAG: hypothetical protein M1812_002093 [Candelaria pacifica]